MYKKHNAAGERTRSRMFRYIVLYKRTHDGNSPSIKQIGDAVGISTNVVHSHLRRLEAEGRIVRSGDARSIMVVGGQWSMP